MTALLFLWAALAAAARAQEPEKQAGKDDAQAPDGSALAMAVQTALQSPELPTLAAGLLDSIGGRLSGTPTGTRAEAWAANWLRNFGLDSVWHEVVRIPVWRRGGASVQVVAPAALRHRRLYAIAYGYSPGLVADSVPVIDIGRGGPDTLAALGERVQGAALLTDAVRPESLELAGELGAVAMLRVSFEPGRLPQARLAPTEEPPAALPLMALSREDGLWLRRLLPSASPLLTLRVVAETRPGAVANVLGEWRGSDPAVRDEVVLLGAHLDSWDVGDGALDNGTGVLAVMAAMRALSQLSSRPRRTIRVVFFAGEELGLLGSRAYVRDHAGELGGVVAMMNLDMVGAPQAYGATGHSEADTLFARLVREPGVRDLALAAEVEHGGGAGSDHQPFVLAGVPTIYVLTSLPPATPRWYHNAADTGDKIDLDAVKAAAAAVAAAIWELADHPGRPLRHLTPQETRQLVQRLGW